VSKRLTKQHTSSGAARSGQLRAVASLLCAAGCAAAIKLVLIHRQVHQDNSIESFCAISDSVNCDTVALSPYSVFLDVPVAVWGVFGYGLMSLVLLWGWRSRTWQVPTVVLTALAMVSVSVSAILAVISALYIRSLCILCMTTYVINLALLVLCVMLWKRDYPGLGLRAARALLLKSHGALGGLFAVATIAVTMLWAGLPRYWVRPANASDADSAAALPAGSSSAAGSPELATGVTADGHWWTGAREPELTLVEFSDYQCPFCSRAHWRMRALVAANPTAIRLVHRHFPLDHTCNPTVRRPFHRRACRYAALAVCAAEQKQFWSANDYLYAHGRDPTLVEPELLAQELGLDLRQLRECLDQRASAALELDLQEGIQLKINATPSFVVDGKVYPGMVPPQLLAPYLPAGALDEAG
jgi:protein-disulfide isomerase